MRRKEFWLSAAAGAVFGLGACLPESVMCIVLGWCTALMLAVRARSEEYLARDFFIVGLSFYFTAFHWIYYPIHYFGGFPIWLAALLQVLFAVVCSLQFAVCGWLLRRLKRTSLDAWLLPLPLAWWTTEFLIPRLFPWMFSHTQADFHSLAAFAELSGAYPLGALMFWASGGLISLLLGCPSGAPSRKASAVIPLVVVAVVVCWGSVRTAQVKQAMEESPAARIGVVQGNLDIYEKGNIHLLSANLKRYQELSKQAVAEGANFLFWPESISTRWIRDDTRVLRGTKADPYPGNARPLLYGGLTIRVRARDEVQRILQEHPELRHPRRIQEAHIAKKFNSAIALGADGLVKGMYHKRILMPFGEYIPLADRYPDLKKLSPQTADFDFGDILDPITLKAGTGDAAQEIKAAPLICYEDLIPGPSLDGARRSADLLVNLTNDAWYGDTAAPHQHHLIARWRAIETRRTLVRATNTGLTAVVDPLGRTVQKLPVFEPGYFVHDAELLSIQTVYAKYGDVLSWAASLLTLVVLCSGWLFNRSK